MNPKFRLLSIEIIFQTFSGPFFLILRLQFLNQFCKKSFSNYWIVLSNNTSISKDISDDIPAKLSKRSPYLQTFVLDLSVLDDFHGICSISKTLSASGEEFQRLWESYNIYLNVLLELLTWWSVKCVLEFFTFFGGLFCWGSSNNGCIQ